MSNNTGRDTASFALYIVLPEGKKIRLYSADGWVGDRCEYVNKYIFATVSFSLVNNTESSIIDTFG